MATKKIEITADAIITMYMDYRLENSEKPKSVYQFSKLNGFDEATFYNFFGSIESVENQIYTTFFDKTIAMIQKADEYENYDMKTKMLSFYFTFFELLTANRSYVLLTLNEHKNQLKNLHKLSDLRTEFKNFIAEITSDEIRTKFDKLINIQEKAIQESSWLQLLLILKFWIDDNSASFEKTDIFIEKSVKAAFELLDVSPFESVIDFGKFLFKEKIQRN